MDLSTADAKVSRGETVRLLGAGYARRFEVPAHCVATLSPISAGSLKPGQKILIYCPYNEAYIMGLVRRVRRGRILVAYPGGIENWVSEPTRLVGRLTFEDAGKAEC